MARLENWQSHSVHCDHRSEKSVRERTVRTIYPGFDTKRKNCLMSSIGSAPWGMRSIRRNALGHALYCLIFNSASEVVAGISISGPVAEWTIDRSDASRHCKIRARNLKVIGCNGC